MANSLCNRSGLESKSFISLKKTRVSYDNCQTTYVHYRFMSSEFMGERHVHFEDGFHSHHGLVIDDFPSWMSNAYQRRLMQTSTNDCGVSVGDLMIMA